ncbi:hypothetical protein PFISCL1PPCAC_24178, partial [Pristionchus fissidentatus]
GHPRVTCLTRIKGQAPVLEECIAVPYRSERSVACFTVWDNNGDSVQQGCLRVQDISLRDQCKKTVCVVDPMVPRVQNMNFCCCFGDKCNAVYSN